jgi:hypothetical protein
LAKIISPPNVHVSFHSLFFLSLFWGIHARLVGFIGLLPRVFLLPTIPLAPGPTFLYSMILKVVSSRPIVGTLSPSLEMKEIIFLCSSKNLKYELA